MNRYARPIGVSTLVLASMAIATPSMTQDLGAMTENQREWVMTGRTYDLNRYSTLTQITTGNVSHLEPAWTFSLGTSGGEEGNPLVVGGVMYVSTSFPNKVFALDLTKPTSPQIWQYTPTQNDSALTMACCGTVNRGLAYHPPTADHPAGILYIELLQGDLLALDAKTGAKVYQVNGADFRKGETMTNAPLVVRNVVITGISGGEFGVRGRVAAYDAFDGHEVWRAYSTGPDADVKLMGVPNENYASMKGKDLGASTWQGDEWMRGGGTTWGWFSYDPDLNLFYYGSGNPGTWNPDQRPGDNKWSSSIWARDPATGVVKWVYQMTPHDAWGYDGANEMQLAELIFNGKPTKVLVHFDENGFAYTLDRGNGKVLVAQPYGPVNWATGIDLTSGRPVEDPAKRTTTKGNTEDICPGSLGFKNQQPSAYSPKTKIFFVPINNLCMDYEAVQANYQAGQPYVGAIVRMFPGPGDNRGGFIAWDGVKGKILWQDNEPLAAYGGALVTAADIVFYGTLDGWLKAVDAHNGKPLWKYKTPAGIIGNPITYVGPDGRQYVAVLSGIAGWTGMRAAAGIGGDTPTGGTGGLGIVGGGAQSGTQNGILTVFALDNGGHATPTHAHSGS